MFYAYGNLKLITLHVGYYARSYFCDYIEDLSVQFDKNSNNYRSLSFIDPRLFGFDIGRTLLTETSSRVRVIITFLLFIIEIK
jgi:hypothetical protein